MSQNITNDSNNDLIPKSSHSVSDVKPKNSRKSGKNSKKANDRRHRRPDMKLYVPPKAKSSSSADETEDQSFAQICDKKTDKITESLSELEISDSSHPKDHNPLNSNHKGNNEVVVEDSSWDTLFDENGDSIRPEFVQRVNDLICNKDCDLKLEKSGIDYFHFQYNEPEFDNSEFAHILEVYDFAIELKTQDIMTSISVFK